MESAATEAMEATATVEAACRSARSDKRMANWSASIEARTPIESGVTPITGMTPVAVIPRTGADEDAADKPFRPVVAIRCACIRRVGIVAVGAHRRRANRTNVSRANSDGHRPHSHANANANLRLRGRCWNQKSSEHC